MDYASKLIKQRQLQEKLEKKLGEIKLRSSKEAAKELAKELKLTYSDLKAFPVETRALFLIEEGKARAAQMAILSKSGKTLLIAVAEPNNEETKKMLESLSARNFSYKLIITDINSLERVWQKYKSSKSIKKVQLGIINIKKEEIESLQQKIKNIKDLQNNILQYRVSEILNILIAGALKIQASDIHLEPEKKYLRVRYRLDGILSDIANLNVSEYSKLLSRIKIISGLKINIHDVPQDGRFTINLKNKEIEVRISVLPGAFGENVVMRVLDPDTIKQNLEELGIRNDMLEIIKKELSKTTGTILNTGPTGSGKTTTLYAFIRHINKEGIKIITIEDPIEYSLEGISQTQVNESKGYTFSGGLRSIVRQDPDIILVGEIRDRDTASIAIQAALTGHLVFSTFHTNDAAGAIPRLIDLGLKTVDIGPAINTIIAQRLVRRLCYKCKKLNKIKPQDLFLIKKALGKAPKSIKLPDLNENTEIYYPRSQKCEECNFTGYKGRIGICELLSVDSDIETLINNSPTITRIREEAIKKGMVTMLQDGYLKVLEGITSVEEVQRILGGT